MRTRCANASSATARRAPTDAALDEQLAELNLPFMREHCHSVASTAAEKQWSHLHYLGELASAECAARADRRVQRRIKDARLPVLKTLEQFDWNWPTKINRAQVQHLFELHWLAQHGNAILISPTGLGKTHLLTALGYTACLRAHSVLFTGAIDIVNTVAAAAATGSSIKRALDRYLSPQLLCIDELGYLPIDKFGADILFQIISHRYERGSIAITTNRVYKQWAGIFNNDSVLTSALLDRLLHHAETISIEGRSYRAKDHIEA